MHESRRSAAARGGAWRQPSALKSLQSSCPRYSDLHRGSSPRLSMYPIHPSSPSSHQSISPIDQSVRINRGAMESPALIFGDFPKSIFKISSLCTGTKNTFGSPQKSGDFPKSICEISSLCSLTKNAFVPLQNYLWQAYKIKHFWRAVGSIPTPAMLKVTQRHTTCFCRLRCGESARERK